MLVETKFEMVSHDGKLISLVSQLDIKRRMLVSSFDVKLENRLRVSENILWTNESIHGPLETQKTCFGRQSCRGSF
jgi:hypothetical protein